MAINIASFLDPQDFKSKVDKVIGQIRSSQPAHDKDKIYAPGGLEAELEAEYKKAGIPLNPVTIVDLNRIADSLGVAGI